MTERRVPANAITGTRFAESTAASTTGASPRTVGTGESDTQIPAMRQSSKTVCPCGPEDATLTVVRTGS